MEAPCSPVAYCMVADHSSARQTAPPAIGRETINLICAGQALNIWALRPAEVKQLQIQATTMTDQMNALQQRAAASRAPVSSQLPKDLNRSVPGMVGEVAGPPVLAALVLPWRLCQERRPCFQWACRRCHRQQVLRRHWRQLARISPSAI